MFGEDLEVDLGDYPLGYLPREYEHPQRELTLPTIEYQYKFKNCEDLMRSDVFQQALTKALAWKQKEIDSLRQELLKYLE